MERFAKIVLGVLIPHVTFLKVTQIILIFDDIQIQFGKKPQGDRLMMAHAKPVAIVVGAQDLFTGVSIPVIIAGSAAVIGFVVVKPVQHEGPPGTLI